MNGEFEDFEINQENNFEIRKINIASTRKLSEMILILK